MNWLVKQYSRLMHRSFKPIWKLQSKVASLWVVREILRVLKPDRKSAISWDLDQFQLFLCSEIFDELCRGHGYFSVENASPGVAAPIFARALDSAHIVQSRQMIIMLPHVRIRIVPGWVKVYMVNLPESAPLAVFRDEAL